MVDKDKLRQKIHFIHQSLQKLEALKRTNSFSATARAAASKSSVHE